MESSGNMVSLDGTSGREDMISQTNGPQAEVCDLEPQQGELQYAIRSIVGTDVALQKQQEAKFLLKLREVCNASNRTVVEITCAFKELFTSSVAALKAAVEESLANAGVSVTDDLQEAFTCMQIPLVVLKQYTYKTVSSGKPFQLR